MFAGERFLTVLVVVVGIGFLTGCENPGTINQGNQQVQRQGQAAKLPGLDSLEVPESKNRQIRPETYIAAGRLHESLGRPDEAIQQYRQALQEDSRNVEALNRLGLALNRKGAFRDAEEAFSRAVILAPSRAHLWNNRAFSYILQHRWIEAEADLEKALLICPDFCRARVNLAMVLAQQGYFEEAFGRFCQALPHADAYYNMGLMYQSKDKSVEAAWAFRKALELNPRLSAAAKRLAEVSSSAVSEAKQLEQFSGSPLPEPREALRGLATVAEKRRQERARNDTSDESPDEVRGIQTTDQEDSEEHPVSQGSRILFSDEAHWFLLIDPQASIFTRAEPRRESTLRVKRLFCEGDGVVG